MTISIKGYGFASVIMFYTKSAVTAKPLYASEHATLCWGYLQGAK